MPSNESSRAGERILDLATGTGLASRVIAQRFPGVTVTGSDIAEHMLEHARAVAAKQQLAIDIAADAESLATNLDDHRRAELRQAVIAWHETAPARWATTSRGSTSSRAAAGGSPPPTATFAAAATAMSRIRPRRIPRNHSRRGGTPLVQAAGMRSIWFLGWALATASAHANPAPEHAALANQADAPSGTPATITPAPAGPASAPPIAPSPGAPAPRFAPPGLAPVGCTEPPCPGSDMVEVLPHYGWQIAAADLVGLAIALSAGSGRFGAAVYLFDGAVIHAAHNQPGRAAGSVLLRAGLPIAGAFILGNVTNNDGEVPVGFLLGFGIGLATASVLDAALIAGPVTVRRKPMAWTPQLSATHDNITLGIVGGF